MHKFVSNALKRLADQGVTLTIEEALDDLVRLEKLAAEIKRPTRPGRWNDYEAPVEITGITFHRPTIGVIAWSLQVRDWFEPGNPLGDIALLYAMAHATTPDKYCKLNHPALAKWPLIKWAKRLRIQPAEARAMIDELMPRPKESSKAHDLFVTRMEHGDKVRDWPDGVAVKMLQGMVKEAADRETISAGDHGRLVLDLVAEYGQTPDYWIYEVSLDRIYEAQEHMEAKKNAEADAAAAISGKRSDGYMDAGETSKAAAQGRFNDAARAFERKWLARKKPPAEEVTDAG